MEDIYKRVMAGPQYQIMIGFRFGRHGRIPSYPLENAGANGLSRTTAIEEVNGDVPAREAFFLAALLRIQRVGLNDATSARSAAKRRRRTSFGLKCARSARNRQDHSEVVAAGRDSRGSSGAHRGERECVRVALDLEGCAGIRIFRRGRRAAAHFERRARCSALERLASRLSE